jgi:excisionase family DNA binding protein
MSEAILISKRDAAKALAISLRTLDNLIASKELTVRRVGRRCLIPRRALEEFARRDHSTTPTVAYSQTNPTSIASGRKNMADNLAQQGGSNEQ